MNSKSVKCYIKNSGNIEQAIIPICGTNMADKILLAGCSLLALAAFLVLQ